MSKKQINKESHKSPTIKNNKNSNQSDFIDWLNYRMVKAKLNGEGFPFDLVAHYQLPRTATITEQLIKNRCMQIFDTTFNYNSRLVDQAWLVAHIEFSLDDISNWMEAYKASKMYRSELRWIACYEDELDGAYDYVEINEYEPSIYPNSSISGLIKVMNAKLPQVAPATSPIAGSPLCSLSLSRYVIDEENATVFKELLWASA